MKSIQLLILISLVMFACNSPSSESDTHNHTHADTYTCPMHPSVISDHPGKCPICGMDLVKVDKHSDDKKDLMLTDTQLRLANIKTQKITRKPVGQTVVINAKLALNEDQREVITARAAGRIERLFFKETGVAVRAGEPLYVLYSENLLTLQQEYLLALEQYETVGKSEKRYQSFLESSQKKLLLYGMTQGQINQLNKNALKPTVTFLSPASGVITEVASVEGQYIAEGSTLYTIENMKTLWIEAELYPNESKLVNIGDKISIRSGGQNVLEEATVNFLSPEFRAGSQIVIMRATLSNPDSKYIAGQQVQVVLTHSSKEALALPVDAVIRDENGSHVYKHVGTNTFRRIEVKLGLETSDQVEITDGLSEGDTVAVSGAYLLYSEHELKGN